MHAAAGEQVEVGRAGVVFGSGFAPGKPANGVDLVAVLVVMVLLLLELLMLFSVLVLVLVLVLGWFLLVWLWLLFVLFSCYRC